MATITCRIKKGPHAGTEYYPVTRRIFGRKQYSLDTRDGWHDRPAGARISAEALGWRYVPMQNGGFVFIPPEG